MADKAMVPHMSDLPGVDRPWNADDVRDVHAALDVDRQFGDRDVRVWTTGANDGNWTMEEALSAVQWLNLNHDGYLKLAHVHLRIVRERELLTAARILCFEHPKVIRALGYADHRECADDRNRDILGWKATKGEQAWPMLTRSEWIAWMESPRDARAIQLRIAFAQ